MEDTKPLVTQQKEFHYRDETLKKATFGKLEAQYSIARTIFDNITRRNEACTYVWQMKMSLSIERKYEEEVFLEFSDYQDFDASSKVNGLHLDTPLQVLCFWWSSWWRNSNLWRLKKKQVWKLRELNQSSTFWNFRNVSTLMQGTQGSNSPMEKFSTTKKNYNTDLDGRNKACGFGEHEFDHREKTKLKGFLWKFRTIGILLPGRKTEFFQVPGRLQMLCFWLRPWWRKSNL